MVVVQDNNGNGKLRMIMIISTNSFSNSGRSGGSGESSQPLHRQQIINVESHISIFTVLSFIIVYNI